MKQLEMTPNALAALPDEVRLHEIDQDAPIIVELLDYFRWLADRDTAFPITAGHVWMMYYEGVRIGRLWSEVCEDIGLPVREDWK